MIANPLQFAVVREDPCVEREAFAHAPTGHALLVASGGCTAFAMQAWFPGARFTLVDPNPAQHAHIVARLRVLQGKGEVLDRFSVLDGPPMPGDWIDTANLSECGNFEALFRQHRSFLHEFVLEPDELARLVDGGRAPLERLFRSKWWTVSFDLYFSDAFLVAMFGPAAMQHAAPGSYARHFQSAYETGLRRRDRRANPFLHHLLFGGYLSPAMPDFLELDRPPAYRFTHLQSTLSAVSDFAPFDLIHLSNVLDWMDRASGATLCRRIARELRPGARFTVRQLNHTEAIEDDFPDCTIESFPLDRDRSLFYNRILIGTKT